MNGDRNLTGGKMDGDGTNWFFSAEGTVLRQPRVERREGNERRATLGCEEFSKWNPKGVALAKSRNATKGFVEGDRPYLRPVC
jgi:hypothetical protein